MPDIQTPEEHRAALVNCKSWAEQRDMIAARDAAIRKDERAACEMACLLIVKPGDPAMTVKAIVAQECMRAIRAREPGPGGEGGE
jgi:hypothetical protein